MKQKSFIQNLWRILLYVFIIFVCFVFIAPLFFLVSIALEPINANVTLIPKVMHLENFKTALTYIEYFNFLKNSCILALITVSLTVVSSAFVGFGFARLKGPGKNFLFTIILATMMLPMIVTQVPTYIIYNKFNLLNTFYPWIFGGIGGSAFFIFLYRQFFINIPKEIEESAYIDGCSTFKIFWNLFIPVSKPIIATVSIMAFNGSWGDLITPFMYLHDDKFPLVTALVQIGYADPVRANMDIIQLTSCGVLMFILPVVFLFFTGQKYIVQGIVTTGIKG